MVQTQVEAFQKSTKSTEGGRQEEGRGEKRTGHAVQYGGGGIKLILILSTTDSKITPIDMKGKQFMFGVICTQNKKDLSLPRCRLTTGQ